MYFPFIRSHLRVVNIYGIARLLFPFFFILENSLPRYIPAKFSALRTRSLTELKINFKITLPPQRARCWWMLLSLSCDN